MYILGVFVGEDSRHHRGEESIFFEEEEYKAKREKNKFKETLKVKIENITKRGKIVENKKTTARVLENLILRTLIH